MPRATRRAPAGDAWTTAWRILCLLAATSAALPCTPLWFLVGPIVQGVAIVLVLIFALVIVIADYASSTGSSPRSAEHWASDEVRAPSRARDRRRADPEGPTSSQGGTASIHAEAHGGR